MKLPGLVVFITGGASGLGEATARYLLAQGCKVSIADMNVERMTALTNELGNDNFATFKCDVTEEEQVKAAVNGTAERFGTINVALACAGVAWPSLTLSSKKSLDTDHFKKVFAINVFGGVYVAKYASVIMSKNKPLNEEGERGVLLFVSSIAGQEAQRGQVAYGSSKGAINGMMMPMARDLGRFGIRAAAIAPGLFATPLLLGMP